ncbi:MAG: HAMP domain-containing protein [bacterium]
MLLGLLPTLTGVAIWIGWGLYGDLRRIILEGFDRQLTSPSVVVAAFVDPVDHQWLAEDRAVRALAYSENKDVFYALAESAGSTRLVTLMPATGRIAETEFSVMEGIIDLAYEPIADRLVGLSADRGSLVWIDFQAGQKTEIPGSPTDILEIADAPGMEGVWVRRSDRLERWNLGSLQVAETRAIPAVHQSCRLAGSAPKSEAVMLTNADNRQLVWVTENSQEHLVQAWVGETDFPEEMGYDRKRQRWVMAQERLRGVDPTAGAETGDQFLAAYGREDTDEYRRLMAPLIRLHNRLGLSFLYTQIVEAPDRIIYVADSPESGTYSALRSTDVLPATEVAGITRLKAEGSLYFTGLQQWEQWGWLKSAFAPIFDENGKVVAMAGTDFNASVISHSTRQALLAVFLIGGLTLVVASGWSLVVSRWLRRPIEDLKAQALSVAAGDFRRVHVAGSKEVNSLAAVFNEASAVMEKSVTNLTNEVNLLLRRRDQAEVQRVFVHALSPDAVFAEISTVEVVEAPLGLGGVVSLDADHKLVWWEDLAAPGGERPLVKMGSQAGQVRVRFGGMQDSESQPSRWPEGVAVVLRLDTQARTAVGWYRDARDRFSLAHSGSDSTVGWAERGPVLKLIGFRLKEDSK